MSEDSIVGVVAHELAHLLNRHLERPTAEREMETTEKEADATADAWGFAKELSAFRNDSPLVEQKLWGELAPWLEDQWKQNASVQAS